MRDEEYLKKLEELAALAEQRDYEDLEDDELIQELLRGGGLRTEKRPPEEQARLEKEAHEAIERFYQKHGGKKE